MRISSDNKRTITLCAEIYITPGGDCSIHSNKWVYFLSLLQTAPVSWRKNQKLLEHYSESTSDDGAVTTNFLTFVPNKEDNGKLLACTAFNPQFSDFRIEDTLHLDVHCNYVQAEFATLLCLSFLAKQTTKPSSFFVDAPLLLLLLLLLLPCRCAHPVTSPWSERSAARDSWRKQRVFWLQHSSKLADYFFYFPYLQAVY